MREKVHCEWCAKEVAFLHKMGEFSEKDIKSYTVYYGVFKDGQPESFRYAGLMAGYSEEEAKEAIEEIATWLAENSPYRGGHPRCWVCQHVKEDAFA